MTIKIRNLSLAFSAGVFGGICNGLIIWISGIIGITTALGVNIAPALNQPFIYNKIVWGGIWGFLLLLPVFKGRVILKGFSLSLLPSLIQLMVVFPMRDDKGLMGLSLGLLTPLFVIIFNAVWGIAAVYLYNLSDD